MGVQVVFPKPLGDTYFHADLEKPFVAPMQLNNSSSALQQEELRKSVKILKHLQEGIWNVLIKL
jgi:hypothetical protein